MSVLRDVVVRIRLEDVGLVDRLEQINTRVNEVTGNLQNLVNQLRTVETQAQTVARAPIPVPQPVRQIPTPVTLTPPTTEEEGLIFQPERTPVGVAREGFQTVTKYVPVFEGERYPEEATVFAPTETEIEEIMDRIRQSREVEMRAVEQAFEPLIDLFEPKVPEVAEAQQQLNESLRIFTQALPKKVASETLKALEEELGVQKEEAIRSRLLETFEARLEEPLTEEEEEEGVLAPATLRRGRRRRITRRTPTPKRATEINVNVEIHAQTITSADLLDVIKNQVKEELEKQLRGS